MQRAVYRRPRIGSGSRSCGSVPRNRHRTPGTDSSTPQSHWVPDALAAPVPSRSRRLGYFARGVLHKFQTFAPLRNLKTRRDPSSAPCCLPKTHLRLWDSSSRLNHPSHFPQNLGVAGGRERTRQTPPLLSLGTHTGPEVGGNRHIDGEPGWPWLTLVPSLSFPASWPLPCFSSHPTPRHSTAKLSLRTQTSPSRRSHHPGGFPRGAGRDGVAGQGRTVVPGAPRSPRMVRRRVRSLPPPPAARPARPAASAPSAPRPRRPSGAALTPRPPSRRGNGGAARPPPPSPAPQSRGSAPRGAEAGREGLPGKASRTRLWAARFSGLRSGRGAVGLDSLPRRPQAPVGSAAPASSAPVLQVCLLSHKTGAGRAPSLGWRGQARVSASPPFIPPR